MNVNSINSFLDDFKSKMKIWDIIFRDDRGKNFQSLIDLEISSAYRKEILEKLKSEDYSEGPLEDKLNNSTELWVFGKEVKGKEIYIKNAHWIKESPNNKQKVFSRIRQVGELLPSTIEIKKKTFKVTLKKPITGVSEGQAIVLYEKDKCLGGGVISFQ
jgi:hypothetical protein